MGSKQETVDQAREALNHVNAHGYVVQSKNINQIQSLVGDVEEKYDHIDVLINNAGVSDAMPFDRYDDDHFVKIIDVNVNFLMRITKAVTKVMIKQKSGVILYTSSMVSFNGQPSGVAYPTSKFAVNGLIVSLARELGKYNIRVNAVAPCVTETDMVKALNTDTINRIKSTIPLGRVGQPEDIANAFLFLVSDFASYISGAILRVDGATIV